MWRGRSRSLEPLDCGFGVAPAVDHDVLQVPAEGDFDRGVVGGFDRDEFGHRAADSVELAIAPPDHDLADTGVEAGAVVVETLEDGQPVAGLVVTALGIG